jgi:general secretion pathway protein C
LPHTACRREVPIPADTEMLAQIHKYFWLCHLLLVVLLGAVLGQLAAVVTEIRLTPPPAASPTVAGENDPRKTGLALKDHNVILERNIFDSRGPAAGRLAGAATTNGTRAGLERGGLTLLGTMVAGERSLALLATGKETALFHLDDILPGEGRLKEISRRRILVAWPDGTEQELLVEEDHKVERPAAKATESQTIRSVGENRWLIARSEVDRARANLSQVLKSARLEPKVVNGRTEGFLVRMIRPRSLLEKLGLKRGDLVKEVNGVELNSPEKALQVFQQLREAKKLSVSLLRNGRPLTYEYEVE